MVDNMSFSIQCRFHERQLYQLYCSDCKDCVCLECLNETHKKHSFCQLQDAEAEIREELQPYLADDQEGNQRINNLSKKLHQTTSELEKEMFDMRNQIEVIAQQMKLQVDSSKEDLLSSLENMMCGHFNSVSSIQDRLETLQSNCVSFKTGIRGEQYLNYLVWILSEVKTCFEIKDKIEHFLMPVFQQSNGVCKVGELVTRPTAISPSNDCLDNNMKKNNESSNIPSSETDTICTQIEDLDETDSDVEWFDADDAFEIIENSSDEVKEEECPLVINLDNVECVHKIIPVSDHDAWILSNRTLRKITRNILEDFIYAKSVDDITTLNDGSVLVLSKDNKFITKLLPNKQFEKFVSVPWHMAPFCLCCTEDGSIFITLRDSISGRNYVNHCISKCSREGIKIYEKQFELHKFQLPYYMQNTAGKQGHLYVLYQTEGYPIPQSTVRMIDKNTGNILKTFNGAVEMNPSADFKCYGMTLANDGSILVSDHIQHSIFALSKYLELRTCIMDATHGLQSPMAIAVHASQLWVADQNKIYILKYDS